MVSAKKHVPIVKKRDESGMEWQEGHMEEGHMEERHMEAEEDWEGVAGLLSRIVDRRARFRGTISMPKIGYGSNKATRHMMPNGFRAFVVKNPKDVELLLMHNRTYAAEIAHNVSSQKRVAIIAKAKALNVKVTNPKGRVATEN
ncbi:60S ribosomal protein L32 [Ascosphaera acerosa]|nr:60S ribosomal protein L32 [Ascosphaera acerosa]